MEKLYKWSFCAVCRRNHEEGRKHIFSKHHKTNLAATLSKFGKKVRSARRCLAHPSVMDGELEPGEMGKMWCYCCEEEIRKHATNGRFSIEWGGLLEHMAELKHHKMTRKFWWTNGADSNQLQTFILFSAEYRRFKELTIEALSKLEDKKQQRTKQLAEDLRAEEEHRAISSLEPPTACETVTKSQRTSRRNRNSEKRRITSSANSSRQNNMEDLPGNGQTLTSVARKQVPGVVGNVHTGATPPWLREDTGPDVDNAEGSSAPSNTVAATIGPSLEDFILHKERKKRAGRNPNRVGADFHIKLATQKQPDSDDWLPAFGRVWNYGPRFHSKEEFMQELGKKSDTTGTSNLMIKAERLSNAASSSEPTIHQDPLQPNITRKSVFNPGTPSSSAGPSEPLWTSHDPVRGSHDPLAAVVVGGAVSHDSSHDGTVHANTRRHHYVVASQPPPLPEMNSIEVKPYVKKRKWNTDTGDYVVDR